MSTRVFVVRPSSGSSIDFSLGTATPMDEINIRHRLKSVQLPPECRTTNLPIYKIYFPLSIIESAIRRRAATVFTGVYFI